MLAFKDTALELDVGSARGEDLSCANDRQGGGRIPKAINVHLILRFLVKLFLERKTTVDVLNMRPMNEMKNR